MHRPSLGPLIVVLIFLAVDVWVYEDARARAERGRPVVFRMGGFVLSTPFQWLLGCVLLWIVFFPLYVARRST